MANLSDFWGKAEGNKKPKKQKNRLFELSSNISRFFSKIWQTIKPIFVIIGKFFGRIFRLPRVLNRVDKIALAILFVLLVGLLGYKFNRDVLSKTKKVAAVGGTYEEILIGEAKYLNPVLAKTDTDRTINQLIYSGLTRLDSSGTIQPDLAEKFEISEDGKNYIFHLRPGVQWQDGFNFSSADVAATISSIKDSSIKSPYYESWKDVEVATPDDKTVIFHLSSPYGPFIYNTIVGIIPAHLDGGSISASPVGTGPYRFTKVTSGKNSQINEVVIERSENFYGKKPYIKTVKFQIAKDENEARNFYSNSSLDSLAGLKVDDNHNKNYSYPTSRQFGMVFNLRNPKFSDIAIRNKIRNKEKTDPKFNFSLLVLDKPLSVNAAENLVKEYRDLGVEIIINKKGAVEYQDRLQKREFEAVLYGFDTGYDRDPYPFWHSSQIEKGNNFSGFSNKPADILLEDARMATDTALRNQKYDQFFALLRDQSVAIFLPAETFKFTIRNKVQGIVNVSGSEPWDHLNSFSDWYLKTKRVKP